MIYGISQIYNQYPCSFVFFILPFLMKPDTTSIIISGIKDIPLYEGCPRSS